MNHLRFIMVSILMAGITTAASAKETWYKVAELTASKKAAEVTVGREISRVRITCIDESVIINVVAVRHGRRFTQVIVGKQLVKGKNVAFEVGGRKHVTGLRIGHALKGRYEVYVDTPGPLARPAGGATRGGWTKIAEQIASKQAVEVPVNRKITTVRMVCVKDSVIINVVAVRYGGKFTQVVMGKQLKKGEATEFSVGDTKLVTGLRIGHDLKGRYEIYVQ